MEIKPISFDDALSLYDEESTGEVDIMPIVNPEDALESDKDEKRD